MLFLQLKIPLLASSQRLSSLHGETLIIWKVQFIQVILLRCTCSRAHAACRAHPELPPIKRCHKYKITHKFTYKCTKCGYEYVKLLSHRVSVLSFFYPYMVVGIDGMECSNLVICIVVTYWYCSDKYCNSSASDYYVSPLRIIICLLS